MEFEVLDELTDPGKIERLEHIASEGPVKQDEASNASRLILGYENGDLISYSSLKPSYPQGTDISNHAVEIFQIGVDKELRGQGFGRETFEKSLEEANRFGKEREMDHIYMTVWNNTTDLYHEAKESVKENEEFFSEDKIVEYCEENDIDTEELYSANPVNHLAKEYGFDSYDGTSFRNTLHVTERPVKEEETSINPKAQSRPQKGLQ